MISKIIEFIKWKTRGEIPTNHLIKTGLKVGENFKRQQECIIDYSHCWLISIGDDVTLAPRVHILAHDASTKTHLGYTKIGLVNIGDRVFIGADSIVLPNVNIGDDVIIGAGSVVTKDIPSGCIAVGNPARVIGKTIDYIEKHKMQMKNTPIYDETWTIRFPMTIDQKNKMVKEVKGKGGYVE